MLKLPEHYQNYYNYPKMLQYIIYVFTFQTKSQTINTKDTGNNSSKESTNRHTFTRASLFNLIKENITRLVSVGPPIYVVGLVIFHDIKLLSITSRENKL